MPVPAQRNQVGRPSTQTTRQLWLSFHAGYPALLDEGAGSQWGIHGLIPACGCPHQAAAMPRSALSSGFGLGAAVGARGTGGARVTLTFGVFGGLLGAAFGSMPPSFHVRSPYRRGPWPYDEDELASNSGPSSGTSKSGSRTATPPPATAALNPGPPETATAVNDRLRLSAEPPKQKLSNLCCLLANAGTQRRPRSISWSRPVSGKLRW
jgi:hypothetical protein